MPYGRMHVSMNVSNEFHDECILYNVYVHINILNQNAIYNTFHCFVDVRSTQVMVSLMNRAEPCYLLQT